MKTISSAGSMNSNPSLARSYTLDEMAMKIGRAIQYGSDYQLKQILESSDILSKKLLQKDTQKLHEITQLNNGQDKVNELIDYIFKETRDANSVDSDYGNFIKIVKTNDMLGFEELIKNNESSLTPLLMKASKEGYHVKGMLIPLLGDPSYEGFAATTLCQLYLVDPSVYPDLIMALDNSLIKDSVKKVLIHIDELSHQNANNNCNSMNMSHQVHAPDFQLEENDDIHNDNLILDTDYIETLLLNPEALNSTLGQIRQIGDRSLPILCKILVRRRTGYNE